jgi:hypothetical protein
MSSRKEENAVFLRTERRNHMLIGLAIALGLAGVLWMGLRHPTDPLHQPAVARMCRAAYAQVSSSPDTAIVDLMAPVVDPEVPAPKLTCGELRMAGRLQQ